jgi:hypothetical protein
MRLIYEAANTIEGHMVLNLLEQAGLQARIDGEYLQGGVGELQAMGVVRVMVEESDYAEAKLVVEDWDARHQEPQGEPIVMRKSGFGGSIIGFCFGIAAAVIYYQTPVTYEGIDHDGDGVLDVVWTYVNYRVSKSEGDRNFDGEMDVVSIYGRQGTIQSTSLDDDFDGVFETKYLYEQGNLFSQTTDTTGDGFVDYRVNYKYGIWDTVSFIDPRTRRPIKVQEFSVNLLKRAEIDTNRDGTLDTVYEYDALEEIQRKYEK